MSTDDLLQESEEKRRNFIRTLDETVEIAIASGHTHAAVVLQILSGMMEIGTEPILARMCGEFGRAGLDALKEAKRLRELS
jgi:hypothetical protein